MEKELYAALALFTMCGHSSAQTVSVIGHDNNTIATYSLNQIKQIVFNPNSYNDHEYVDLGLSVKWATCNIGASASTDYGDYFAWGETETKESYKPETSLTQNKTLDELRIAGITDASKNLTATYDAATVNWGGTWRMPTKDEIVELLNKCIWTWTTENGVNGYKVISRTNDNYIFVPAAGFREGTYHINLGSDVCYWSCETAGRDNGSYFLSCDSNGYGYGSWERYYGFPVRPVTE